MRNGRDKPVWEWNWWDRFMDALRYWLLESWVDYLIDHPMARVVFEIAMFAAGMIATIFLLVYLQVAGYIPRSWWL